MSLSGKLPEGCATTPPKKRDAVGPGSPRPPGTARRPCEKSQPWRKRPQPTRSTKGAIWASVEHEEKGAIHTAYRAFLTCRAARSPLDSIRYLAGEIRRLQRLEDRT